MSSAPRKKRTAASILLQWAVVVVFFLPIWLAYVYMVAPGVKPESRFTLDVAVPICAFVFCSAASFAFRAWQRKRHDGLPTP
jgi:hypothetical protein